MIHENTSFIPPLSEEGSVVPFACMFVCIHATYRVGPFEDAGRKLMFNQASYVEESSPGSMYERTLMTAR